MDLSKLSMSELQALQKRLEAQLKSNPAEEMAIAEAIKAKPMEPPASAMPRLQEALGKVRANGAARGIIGGETFPLSPENTKALGRAVEDDAVRAIIGGDKFPLSPENTKALGRAVEDDAVKAVTTSGRSKSMLDMLDAMTPDARNAVINRPDIVGNIEKEIKRLASQPVDLKGKIGNYIEEDVRRKLATSAPMETPYGKSLLSYTPEGKIAGKTGAALRGLGKLASRVASPIGAALTAIDLGQALSEVQDKGAAKIAEDYRKEQERKALAESEDMGDKVIEKMNPIQSNSKQYSLEENVPSSAKSQLGSGARRDYQSSKYSGNPSMKNESTGYSPEERAKLKDMLSKYRATPTLR